ncbi:MAG: hypothetical protein K2M76_00275, partial [Muribaculaceae bacterium]|nr:hypothetical protein [Muribaculaceae bacterium]
MWNVANRFISVAVAALMLTACGDTDREAANKLLAQSREAVTAGDFYSALEIMDTLQARYPAQIEVQREALQLRPVAMEGVTIRELEQTDSLLAVSGARVDSLSRLMRTVSDARLVEPYMVAASSPRNMMEVNGLQARLGADNTFTVVSVLRGNDLKHTSVTLGSGTDTATSGTVEIGNDANFRINGTETVTYTGEKCDTLGRYAVSHDNSPLQLTFNGRRKYSIRLSAAQVHGIA